MTPKPITPDITMFPDTGFIILLPGQSILTTKDPEDPNLLSIPYFGSIESFMEFSKTKGSKEVLENGIQMMPCTFDQAREILKAIVNSKYPMASRPTCLLLGDVLDKEVYHFVS